MAYAPTHDAPEGGLSAYAAPDPTKAPVAQLDPGLDVQLLERRADWAHIACSNGWEAWVDARRLVERATPTPEPTPPPPPPAATEPASAPAAVTPAAVVTTETQAMSATTPASTVPPSAEWTVPPPERSAAVASGGTAIAAGQIVGFVGAALILLSTWMAWISVDFFASELNFSSYQVPAKSLIDYTTGPLEAGVPVGVLLIVAVSLTIVGALVRQARFLIITGGAIGGLVALLFMYQTWDGLNDRDFETGLFDYIGLGPAVALVGGAAAVVGGVVALRQP